MPRYFFDTDNHVRDVDEEGTQLASADDARVQAVIFAGDYLREHPDLVWDGSRFSVIVRDEAGTILLNVLVTPPIRPAPSLTTIPPILVLPTSGPTVGSQFRTITWVLSNYSILG